MKGRRAAFLVISALVIALAAFWRFHHLTLKPFHHDEGVNWYFLDKWFTEGVYAYDPTNFHGPLLYEIAYLPARFIGQGEAVLRAMPALMGLAAIAFLLGMRRWIGAGGALIVGALLAIAPVDVYFSRTFIHEAYLVASLMMAADFLLRYLESLRVRDLFGLLAAVVFAFCFKETAGIATASAAAAYLLATYVGGAKETQTAPEGETGIPVTEDFPDPPFGWPVARMNAKPILLLDAVAVALTIWILSFTTFMTNPHGIVDFFVAFVPWLKTGAGGDSGHEKEFVYFFQLMGKFYWPLLVLAVFALKDVVVRRRRVAIFFFAWFALQLLIYSLIPYKTPWCVMTIAAPLAPLAALGATRAAAWLGRRSWRPAPVGAAALAVFGAVMFARSSWDVNFVRYDDDRIEIVYVQTRRAYMEIFPKVRTVADRVAGSDTEVMMVDAASPTKYYMRDYLGKMRNYADIPAERIDLPIVLVSEAKLALLRELLLETYVESRYPIWPGQTIVLLLRADLWPESGSDGTKVE